MKEKRLWPTPVSTDYKGGVSIGAWGGYSMEQTEKRMSVLRHAVTYPTPRTTGMCGGTGAAEQIDQLYEDGVIDDEERRSMRAGNGGQLNPDWTEALMLWPVGWTSLEPMGMEAYREWEEKALKGTLWSVDPADLSPTDTGYIPRATDVKTARKERLMAIGNGQVPSCACLAEAILERCLRRYAS